ncbi:hypothetical protein NGM10_02130 [Halorussus salilacus]|uniref:hypothetical protein n=1 Tax=Halorussus salilacus TaxID=2953750 RepID=UPI0020A01EB1|nr:hypothetical protein [Halorussus salilacus]USZ68549.1 hypothetical protein NGM10_02130 [Halorussus salilacus]
MDDQAEAELERTLKRSYGRFIADELLDEQDRDLLRRAFPKNDTAENAVFAARNDLDAHRGRLTIHSEWDPEVPPDDAVIRRYLSVDRFWSLLEASGLWFSRIDGFSDQFEATLPKPNADLRDAVKRWSGRDSTETEHNERMRKRRDDRTYINCWRLGEDESAVFWNAYIGDEYGVAVETTVGDFRAAVEMDVSDGYVELYREYVRSRGPERAERQARMYDGLSKLQVGAVEYLDYDEDAIPGSTFSYSRYFHKRNAFEDEREFRAVFEDDAALTPEVEGYDSVQLHGLLTGEEMHVAESGQYVPVDTERLVTGVVLAPGTSESFRTLVELTLQDHGVDVPVTRSRLDETPN